MRARGLGRAGLFLLGAALLASSAWVGLRLDDAIGVAHWSYAVLVAVAFGAGAVLFGYLLVLLARDGRDEPSGEVLGRPATSSATTTRALKVAAWTVVGASLAALAVAVVRFEPHTATFEARSMFRSDDVVQLVENEDWYALVPREPGTDPLALSNRKTAKNPPSEDQVARTGLVFFPDDHVDARAEAAVLRPVAEAGFVVVVVSPPLGLASLGAGTAASATAAFPDVERWTVGGQGAGGDAAAAAVGNLTSDGEPARGLILYSSSPQHDISDAQDLQVVSLWGTEDRSTTAAQIAASRAALPSSTRFARVEGAAQSSFADYRTPRGGGTPEGRPEDVRTRISSVSIWLMDRVAAAPDPEAKADTKARAGD